MCNRETQCSFGGITDKRNVEYTWKMSYAQEMGSRFKKILKVFTNIVYILFIGSPNEVSTIYLAFARIFVSKYKPFYFLNEKHINEILMVFNKTLIIMVRFPIWTLDVKSDSISC